MRPGVTSRRSAFPPSGIPQSLRPRTQPAGGRGGGGGSSCPTTPADYEEAASLFRACRQNGEKVRSVIDCLIAATAIRAAVPLLHADADFDRLARHTGLEIAHP